MMRRILFPLKNGFSALAFESTRNGPDARSRKLATRALNIMRCLIITSLAVQQVSSIKRTLAQILGQPRFIQT